MANAWIYTDADNTLWDTNAVFAEAQLALLDAGEQWTGTKGPHERRLEFVRSFDQAIAKQHHAGLRYPPALLVRSLFEGLRGATPSAAADAALIEGFAPGPVEAEALNRYSAILSRQPPLLPGVLEGLQFARRADVPAYVVSEGPVERLRERLRVLNLQHLVSGALSATKSLELYLRLKQRAAPREVWMIGDQFDKDIRLAHQAGLRTILVLGAFHPHWENPSDATLADAVVDTFLDAIRTIIG